MSGPTFDVIDKTLDVRGRASRLEAFSKSIKAAQDAVRAATEPVRQAKDTLAAAEAEARFLALAEAESLKNKELRDAAVARALAQDPEVRRLREQVRKLERAVDAARDEVQHQENGFAGARAAADLISGSLRAIAR